jgi:S-DNA-T family DNA segregation ATPase FtsK/SpoIIIE
MAAPGHPANDVTSPRRSGGRSSTSRRTTVIAILMMVIAVLLFIAIVTYDIGDEANADVRFADLFKILTGDAQAKAKADTAHNGLGLLGAVVADLLVKSTIGFTVLCLPALIMLWAWYLLRRRATHQAIIITNYVVVAAVLFSASFGMGRLVLGGVPGMEWSGVVGDYLASILAQLLGRVGGSLVLFAGLLITAILAMDLDIHETIERGRALWARTAALIAAWQERRALHQRSRRIEGEQRPTGRASEVKITRPQDEPPAEALSVPRPIVKREVMPPAEDNETPRPQPRFEVRKKPQADEPEETEKPVSASQTEEIDYVFPSVELLDPPRPGREDVDEEELKENADLLRATLAEFDVELESVSVTPGPVVTLYELVPASGVKISSIVSLENDIALKLAARGIRIMAPIPGKSAVGVEIPNSHRSLVTIRSVINSSAFRDANVLLPLAMGKTISGEVFTDDLSRMPHLLIAGSTGSGKSVGINTILASLLYKLHPSDLKLVIIDPKKIELAQYAKLKNHFIAIAPDIHEEIVTTPNNAVTALRSVEYEMEKRYDRLAAAGVRNIVDYNERLKSGRLKDTETITHGKMPFLVVVIDELADLMITAAREVEEPIARLAQLARAVGIHLIVATQRPSVDVITGVIKANFPARIAYQVASKTDSRTILDMNGAEQLLGNGDMLYLASGSPKPVRLQNAYISPDEVEAVVDHVGKQQGYLRPFTLPSILEKKRSAGGSGGEGRDELFEEAARLIVRHQQGSVSLLQRRLKVGYSRAARLVDELEAAGIVGPFDGSKAREVLVESEAELEAILNA